jgi:hypothetical protein
MTLALATTETTITGILEDVSKGLAGLFEQMDWAEDEITRAKVRAPGDGDSLYHSFCLLTPTHELMGQEFVYRSHCREILNRVINGEDTRPGTAAEICCALCDVSQVAPMTLAGTGLYIRMWGAAFPSKRHVLGNGEHYEALDGSGIDDAEATSRRKLAVKDRRLSDRDIACCGKHHGEQVLCKYAGQ